MNLNSQIFSEINKKDIAQESPDNYNFAKYARSPIDNGWSKRSLTFQQLEIDHYIGNVNPSFCSKVMAGSVPILRMYGSTAFGDSVLVHVHGFYPYFYVLAPVRFKSEDCFEFKSTLNCQLVKSYKNLKEHEFCVLDVGVEYKQNIFGYQGDIKSQFIRITLTNIKYVNSARKLLEDGFAFNSREPLNYYKIFESDVAFEIRFMIDMNMTGCCWCEIQSHNLSARSGFTRSSRCSMEIDVNFSNIMVHDSNDSQWEAIAPLRILSFDIECAGRKGIFPQPSLDPVIQIANVLKSYNVENTTETNIIFTLSTCAPIFGANVLCFETEAELLTNWTLFIQKYDPDIITGYNIENFDLSYLISRAEALKLMNFPFLGRIKDLKSSVKDSTFQSKQMGRHDFKSINMEGRIVLDVYWILIRNHKLRSYSLNSVAFHFLGEQKEDVKHSIITDLQNGDDQTRRRLAVYCLKDARLPLKLLEKLMLIVNHVEMARVTGVPLSYLLKRGQQIKVVSQLYRKCRACDIVIPNAKQSSGDEEFTGATVIEPIKGFYNTPIVTLDFTSLYPSIMIAHNLCYSTLVLGYNEELSLKDYEISPTGNKFVRSHVKKGILPEILEDLLKARKKAKTELKMEKDNFRKQILDGRQLALKMSANSVYGFTGAQNGRLPCLEISQSVTSYGRNMIELTKNEIESEFNTRNGCDYDTQVIYGDTDSVMCNFGYDDIGRTMKIAFKAASFVSSKFPRPINLDFEKVISNRNSEIYYPYLLINKKRYAGVVYPASAYSEGKTNYSSELVDCKGIENVRRDNCPLVANLISNCLNIILIQRDPDAAVNHTKQIISDLLRNQIDISHLVISRELTRNEDEYSGKQAHVELAARMRKRDEGTAPKLGDRVPYVIIASAKGVAAYMKSEDPLYVLENNVPIDTDYYLNNQIKKPLLRIFEPILGSRTESILFSGDHANQKKIVTTKVGGLMNFVKKSSSCVKCRSLIRNNTDRALCNNCEGLRNQLSEKYIHRLRMQEERFSKLWVQCQRCQGSFHDEVICSNRDCPIFYMRIKARKDLKESSDILNRFDW